MAFELDFPEESPAERLSASQKGGALTLDWPTEPLVPKPESAAWTLYESAKMTAGDIGGVVERAGKAVADVILPADPSKQSLGERVVQGAMAAVSPPATMEADLKALAPKEKPSGFKLSTDVVERPAEAQGPEAILEGARKVAKETKSQSSLIQRALRIDPAEAQRRAEASIADHEAFVEGLAARTGRTKQEISYAMGPSSSKVATAGFIDGFGLGLPMALADAYGVQLDVKPKDRSVFDTWSDEMNRVAFGVGKLAGEVTGVPWKIAGQAVTEVFGRWLLPKVTDAVSMEVAKFVAREAATIAMGSALSKTGESLEQQTADAALKIQGKAAAKGGLFGLVFGGVKGSLPGEELAERAARIGLGTAVLDLVEGQHPLDNRSLLEKAHDYALNAVFLFHGHDAAEVVGKMKDDAKAKGITIDDEFRTAVAESKAKVNEAQWARSVEIFKRQFMERGYTDADATIAAQRAAARHIAENVGVAARPPAEPGTAAVTAEPREGTLPARPGEPTLDFPAEKGAPKAAAGPELDFPEAVAGPGQEIAVDPVRQAVEAAGAVYNGTTADGVWFTEPTTGSTLLLPVAEATPEGVKAEIGRVRKTFGVEEPAVSAEAPVTSPAIVGTGPEAPAPRAPEAPPAPLEGKPTVAKPETVFKQVLYRGSGAPLEKVYGPEKVAAGTAVPIMGKAKYYAMTEEDARFYGDEIAREEVGLQKPLVIDSTKKWNELLESADAGQLSSVDRAPGDIPAATERLQAFIKGQGYDGVIVRFPSAVEGDVNERGESIKRLRESFGHSQVIKFPETTALRTEQTPAGEQGVIGGTPGRAMPTTAIRRGDRGVTDLPLVAASQETARQADLPAGEALDPQRAAVQEWLTDQLGSGPAMSLATAKSAQLMPKALRAKLQSLGINPKDAWDVTHAEVPTAGAMQRLVGLSTVEGRALPSVGKLEVKPKMLPGGPALDYNSVNTRDPLEVDQFIRGVGGLNLKAYAAELADAPLYLKNNAAEQTIDTLARDIGEAQGRDQYEIVNELLDSLRALAGKKAEAATKPWSQPEPPRGMGVSPAEWQAMSASERQGLWEFADAMERGVIPDMEAKFIDRAPELKISGALGTAREALAAVPRAEGLPEGFVRLYRRENAATPPKWMRDSLAEQGLQPGGWFRARPKGAGSEAKWLAVDVPRDQAEQYRVQNLAPEMRAMSDDPTNDYLLPPEVFKWAKPTPYPGMPERPADILAGRIYDTLLDLSDALDRGEQVIDTYLKMAELVTNDATVRAMTKPEDRTPVALWEWARKKVDDEITQGIDSRREPGDARQALTGGRAEDRGVAAAARAEPPLPATVEPGPRPAAPAPVPAAATRGGERTVRTQGPAATKGTGLTPEVRRDVELALSKLGYKKREMAEKIATALATTPTPTTADQVLTAIFRAPLAEGPLVERMATGPQPTGPTAPTTSAPPMAGLFAKGEQRRKDQLIQSLGQAVRMARAGALIVQGGVQGKSTRGWRHKISGNIHLRKGTDVDTAAHEVGHALQRDGLKVTFKELVPFKQEMVALTEVMDVARAADAAGKMSEGFAEFSRLYMTDPTLARQVAPTFYPWFEARLSTVPALEAAVHQYRDEVLRLRAKNPVERIRSGVAFERGGQVEAGPPKTMAEKLSYGMRRIITDYWNRAVPLREISEALDPAGTELAASKDPHKRYKTLGARIAAVGGHFIRDGIVEAETGRVVPGSKGYHDIVKPVAEHQEDYTVYELIRRMQYLAESDIPEQRSTAENLGKLFDITPADLVGARRDLERQYPHFAGVLDELNTFDDGVLQYLADTGQYSQKAIDTIRAANEIYVPLGRLMESGETGAGGGAFSEGRPIMRLRGTSQRVVLPTLVERARQIYTIIGAAERNLVSATLADALESDLARGQNLGTYMDKVPTPVSVTTTQISTFRDTIEAAFTKAGGDPAVFDNVDWSTLVQIFQPDLSNLKRNQMVIWRRGEPEVWQVYDAPMMLALRQMDRSMVRPWVDAMGWGASVMYKMLTTPVRLLHGGIVHAPDFLVAHLTRQVQEEAAQGYFMPRFIAGTIGKDIGEITRRWRVGGGQVFHFISLDSQSIQRNLDDLRFGNWYEGGVKRSARELIAKFDDVTRWFDQSGRIGVARTVIEHPRPVDIQEGELSVNIDAAFKAREAGGDYEQAGNSVFWRFFSSTIPFVRAAQVHIYRVNRNFREAFDAGRRGDFNNQKVKGILTTGGVMMLLGMLEYLYLADDVRWKQTQQWEKALYYQILWPWQGKVTQAQWDSMTEAQKKAVPGLSRIPKSFFLSWLFSTMPQQVAEYAHDHDPDAFDRMLKNLTESFLHSNHLTLMPGLIKPAYDIARNKNPLSGAPLNPRRLEGLPPERQTQFYTPEVAARASEILQKIPVLKDLHLTPIDIDHLVRGYTGYAGQYTEATLDALARMVSGADKPVMPATRWTEQMAVRRFVARFPNARTQQLDEFYTAYHESQQTLNAIRQMVKEGKTSDEVEGYKTSHGFDPELTGRLMATARIFNVYRQSLDRVMKSKLDAEQKRDAIDRILLQELDTATKTMDYVRQKRRQAAEVPAQ